MAAQLPVLKETNAPQLRKGVSYVRAVLNKGDGFAGFYIFVYPGLKVSAKVRWLGYAINHQFVVLLWYK